SIQNFVIISFMRHRFPFLDWKRQEKYTTSYQIYFFYYTEVFATIDFKALWSFLFYTMLLGLGISSFFGLLETPISALTDQFKFCRKHRSLTIILLSFLGFAMGFVQCSRVGYQIFYILDLRVIPLMAEVLVAFQLLAVVLYGPRNFYRDINASIGKKVNLFGYLLSPYGIILRLSQFVLSPCLIAFTTITRHMSIFSDVWKRMDLLLRPVPWLLSSLAALSLFVWPVVFIGAATALIQNKRAGKAWVEVIRPDPMHPAVRYSVPPPLGCIFGLKPIEAMPSAMGDDKIVEFPDKGGAPKKEEAVVELA
ncbi:hypothetical protein PENTCL1PPCAC_1700, partial [Pristionchus entomophagus]